MTQACGRWLLKIMKTFAMDLLSFKGFAIPSVHPKLLWTTCLSNLLQQQRAFFMAQPVGVHLVGSVPFKSEEEVFSKVLQALPRRLVTVPDGETGIRDTFAYWQKHIFPAEIHGPLFRDFEPSADQTFECKLEDIKPTQYDTAATSSYKRFCKLRDEGVISPGIRFQVSLPGILSVIYSHVDAKYQAEVTPLYERRFLDDIHQLQKLIPAGDLAVQFDLAVEFALLEYSEGRLSNPLFKPYWTDGDALPAILDGVLRLAKSIQPEVPLGFHLCYGDLVHEHFIEPQDMGLLTKVANRLTETLDRPIGWFHMPCPKDRVDEDYYKPLEQLSIGANTKLFLGLVHPHDRQGTLERIATAQKAFRRTFGVATECGMGRTPPSDIDSIFEISAAVTEPAW